MMAYVIINHFRTYLDRALFIVSLIDNVTESQNFLHKSMDSEHCLVYYITVVSPHIYQ